MLAGCLQQGEGADDVGLDERRRAIQGVVVVGLCGKVDDGVVAGDEFVDEVSVTDRSAHQLEAVLGQPCQGGLVGSIGHGIQDGDGGVGVVEDPVGEVAADETGSAGD